MNDTKTWHIHTSYVVGAAVIAVICWFAVRAWQSEHDARLHAEDQERASEAIIAQNVKERKEWQDQITQIQQSADARVAAIRKQQAAIHTPEQAAAALPALLPSLPLSSFRPVPDGGLQLTGDAVVQVTSQLQEGQVCKIQLDACAQQLDLTKKTNTSLTSDNAELKKEKQSWQKAAGKKGFWGNVKAGLKTAGLVALSGLVGYGLHH